MSKNDTGEFELVLGNRQLLSGFAVVAILFGVFFAMGYIVGRNSTPSARLTAEGQAAGAVTTAAGGQAEPGRAPAPPRAAAETSSTAADANAANPAPAGSDAAAQPAPAANPQPATQAARQPEVVRQPEKAVEAAPKTQAADSLTPGSYLQVIATIQTDAEVISKSLQERHFPNAITPSSREGYFRVLVGPYRDSGGVGGAKTELEKLGFHPLLVKIAEKN